MSGPVDVLAVMDAACCVLAIDKKADPQKQLEQSRAAVADLIEAVSKLRVHTYLVTDPDLRELFGGQRRIAVVNMETLEALRDALVTCKGCMP